MAMPVVGGCDRLGKYVTGTVTGSVTPERRMTGEVSPLTNLGRARAFRKLCPLDTKSVTFFAVRWGSVGVILLQNC